VKIVFVNTAADALQQISDDDKADVLAALSGLESANSEKELIDAGLVARTADSEDGVLYQMQTPNFLWFMIAPKSSPGTLAVMGTARVVEVGSMERSERRNNFPSRHRESVIEQVSSL
jgi:hypothetical protein